MRERYLCVMRAEDGALPADGLVALLAEEFEGQGVQCAVGVVSLHNLIDQVVWKVSLRILKSSIFDNF